MTTGDMFNRGCRGAYEISGIHAPLFPHGWGGGGWGGLWLSMMTDGG